MKWLWSLAIVLSAPSLAADDDHVSAFAPSATGISIPNAHWLTPGKILRGNRPLNDAQVRELQAQNIRKVLVFKKFSDAAAKEKTKALYQKNGYADSDLHWVDFPWRDISDYREPCRQTVDALRFLKAHESQGVLFHCTVGEDRTGYLAGLLRQLRDGWSKSDAFEKEMCARGYADASKQKDSFVRYTIHRALSPLFEAMSGAIQNKELRWDTLSDEFCNNIAPKIALGRESYRWCG